MERSKMDTGTLTQKQHLIGGGHASHDNEVEGVTD